MPKAFRITLLSDATGETVSAAAEAVASQFTEMSVEITVHTFVRSVGRAQNLIASFDAVDLVIYTIVNPEIIAMIDKGCTSRDITAVPLLDPVMQAFAKLDGSRPTGQPGKQYIVDKGYLDRVSAIDYAMSTDDGLSSAHLLNADVILVGVSRTSKTPTCIYLAYQGIRAANVPLIPDTEIPDSLRDALAAGIPVVGLIASPTRLSQIRQHRLKVLGNPELVTYVGKDEICNELASARLFFEKHKLPVVDVTRRSIEETAAAIRGILAERKK